LRILFPFVGNTVGGSHISSWQLICGLRELGIDPIILLHQEEGTHATWLANHGETWEVEHLPTIASNHRFDVKARRILDGFRRASKLLWDLNIDLVHGNDDCINRSWVLWCQWASVPMIWHQRSKWPNSRKIRWILPAASGVISISHYVSTTNAPRIKSPHVIIYNPIAQERRDRQECALTLKCELGLRKSSKIIGCFANAKHWKRPDTFVEAARYCQLSNPDLKFIWFGNDYDGSLNHAIISSNRSIGRDNIIHKEFRQNVLSAMAGCDVVVAPSENEPFGRTLVEAMALGIPVIASNAGGHREIIQHEQNGLFFPVGDAQSCASAILRVLDNQLLRWYIVENGLQTAKQFSPIKHAKQVLAFYQSII